MLTGPYTVKVKSASQIADLDDTQYSNLQVPVHDIRGQKLDLSMGKCENESLQWTRSERCALTGLSGFILGTIAISTSRATLW